MRKLIGAGIVVVILAILLGMLLPAVIRVREAAGRSKCQCNLHCLLANIHRHASLNHDTLPTGTIANDEVSPEERLSWVIWALRDYDRDAVMRQLNLKARATDESNRIAIDRRFSYLLCPSSGEMLTEGSEPTWKSPHPVTHYVGIAGVGTDAAMLPMGHPRAGAFGYERRMTFEKGFPDGTTNTLLLLETSFNPGHWALGGPSTVRGMIPDGQYIGNGKQFGGYHRRQDSRFGEKVQVGQVAMVDGSVHQFRSTIAPELVEALATADGKEQLDKEWWRKLD